MTYDPKRHHRRSIRLKGYDYTQAGAYYVTIVCQNRACLFGEIVDGEMILNDAGHMVQAVWNEIPIHYPGVDVDACSIMPNHMHGVILLFTHDGGKGSHTHPDPPSKTPNDVGAGPRTCPDAHAQPDIHTQPEPGQPQGVAPTMFDDDKRLSLPDVVQRFKMLTTKRYTDGVKELGWPRYNKHVWQRNYYEHIIRSERTLNRVREYIDANPANWHTDNENPDVFNRIHK